MSTKKNNKTTPGKTWRNGNIAIGLFLLLPLIILAVRMMTTSPKAETSTAMTGFLVVLLLVLYIFPVALLFNGWYRMIRFPYKLVRSHGSCTQPVQALLSGFERRDETHGQVDWTYYKAIYDYTWEGTDYQTVSNLDYVGLCKEGETCTILINPDSPSELYEIDNEKKRIRKQRLIGIGMMILGAGFYVPLLMAAFTR